MEFLRENFRYWASHIHHSIPDPRFSRFLTLVAINSNLNSQFTCYKQCTRVAKSPYYMIITDHLSVVYKRSYISIIYIMSQNLPVIRELTHFYYLHYQLIMSNLGRFCTFEGKSKNVCIAGELMGHKRIWTGFQFM